MLFFYKTCILSKNLQSIFRLHNLLSFKILLIFDSFRQLKKKHLKIENKKIIQILVKKLYHEISIYFRFSLTTPNWSENPISRYIHCFKIASFDAGNIWKKFHQNKKKREIIWVIFC